MKFFGIWIVVFSLFASAYGESNLRNRRLNREIASRLDSLESPSVDGGDSAINSLLSSGDKEDDVQHYHNLKRRIGLDLGLLIPMGDFQNEFGNAPFMGFHLIWEAIQPFSFTFGYLRSATGQKDNASTAKLSVNTFTFGVNAAFASKRFIPFLKLEGAFYFNDLSLNDGTRYISSGNDINLTTIGGNVGLGIDFVVGRELSFGFDITYHYPVPKKVIFNNGNSFDLGSPFVTSGIRINF